MQILNPSNVLDYFAQSIFYDRQCNNEVIRMQRLNPDQMLAMVGIEYVLYIAQEPILYVIRKQHRHSPTQVVPLAHYYIIAGKVFQSPDMGSVINARLSNCANFLHQAFSETHSYAKYQSAKGYYWEFKDRDSQAAEAAKEEKIKGECMKRKEKRKKEEPSSNFQKLKVDRLLDDLTRKFPLKSMAMPSSSGTALADGHTDAKPETKSPLTNGVGAEPGILESTPTTSISVGTGAKRVAHDVKVKMEGSSDSKPPLEKKIKLEKK